MAVNCTVIVDASQADWQIYRTLRAVERSRQHAAAHGITSELIISLGSASEAAVSAVENWAKRWGADRVVSDGFAAAAGDSVAYIKGGDLVSENWITESYTFARLQQSPVVVHPELVITADRWWCQCGQHDAESDVRQLLFGNLWTPTYLTDRSLATAIYRAEQFAAEAIACGYTHLVVPSTLCTASLPASTLACSDLFDNPRLFTAVPIRPLPPSPVHPAPPADFPDWATTELRGLAAIAPELHPTGERLARRPYQPLELADQASLDAYSWLLRDWPAEDQYSHVFILPWLTTGGADKEIISLITALVQEFQRRVLVITTEPYPSTWLDRLPPGVKTIDLCAMTPALDASGRAAVLARMLWQRHPHLIHVVGSPAGWQLLADYGPQLAQHSTLYASEYCDWFTPEGEPRGYVQQHLATVRDSLRMLLTDSVTYHDRYRDLFALPDNQVRVLYAPVDASVAALRQPAATAANLNVLWAGRLDRHKRPDILLKIAERLPNYLFWVYGKPVLDVNVQELDWLRSKPNVRMMGPYQSFTEVLVRPYGLYLHTAQTDGLPNVVLEATLAGIPVVAPDVGGIKEVINAETGFLVADHEDIGQFVAAIQAVGRDPVLAQQRQQQAIQCIEARHSWPEFVRAVSALPDYL